MIQPLHIGRAVENAVLDFTTLHESSITNRKDATRAMDQLCQRIMASMQFQPQQGANFLGTRNPSAASMQSSFVSMQPSINESYNLPPSPPPSVGSPQQQSYQRIFPQNKLGIRCPPDQEGQRGRYKATQASPLGWIGSQLNQSSGGLTAQNPHSSPVAEEQQQSPQSPDNLELEQRSRFSAQHSTHGNNRGSVHFPPDSATSTIISQYSQSPSTWSQTASENPPQQWQQGTASTDRAASLASGTYRQNIGGHFDGEAKALSIRSSRTKNLQRVHDAPEVVPMSPGVRPQTSAHPDKSSEKYPAYLTQADYTERLLSLPVGMDNIWIPLDRPALHNRYFGFCQGAWQIRKAVRSSLGR